MSKKISSDTIKLLLLIAVCMLANISLIFNDSVWTDEAFTMITLRNELPEIIEITGGDVHPPLYYILAKAVTYILGYSVPAVKIASLIPVLLTMLLVAIGLRKSMEKLHGKSTFASYLIILMLAFMPCSARENIELRMYTWAMFFVTAAAVFAFKIFLNPRVIKNWILFIGAAVSAAYTHYFALVSAAIIYGILFLALFIKNRKYIGRFFLSCVITVICYLPWMPVFYRQICSVKANYWISEFTFSKIVEFLKWPFDGEFAQFWLILLCMCVLLLVYELLKKGKLNYNEKVQAVFLLMCFAVFSGTMAAGWCLSKLIRPIFVDRYLFVCAGLLYIFIAYVCAYLINIRELKIAVFSLTLCTGFSAYSVQINNEYNNGTEETKKLMEEYIQPDDLILTNDLMLSFQNGSPLLYYLPENKLSYITSAEDVQNLGNYDKAYFFCNGEFDMDSFVNEGKTITYIADGMIDIYYPYRLYLIENTGE